MWVVIVLSADGHLPATLRVAPEPIVIDHIPAAPVQVRDFPGQRGIQFSVLVLVLHWTSILLLINEKVWINGCLLHNHTNG